MDVAKLVDRACPAQHIMLVCVIEKRHEPPWQLTT
jgi:hypothetical protein